MTALLVALLFTIAITASIWSMWITIAPRLDYMRALITGDTIPALAPAAAPRVRPIRSATIMPAGTGQFRAAA
jgi:hypothetical protein